MHSRRRLIALAAVSTLAVIGLSACRSAPTVAAYVGDTKFTEDQVTAIYDDAVAKLGKNAQGAPEVAPTRAAIVQTMVIGKLCEKLQADKKAEPLGQVSTKTVAGVENVPISSTYAEQRAKALACAWGAKGTPATPTDDQKMDIYRNVVQLGIVPAEVPFAQVAPELDADVFKQFAGITELFANEATAQNVSVNPRYRTVGFPMFLGKSDGTAVEVPLNVPAIGQPTSNAVADQPTSNAVTNQP